EPVETGPPCLAVIAIDPLAYLPAREAKLGEECEVEQRGGGAIALEPEEVLCELVVRRIDVALALVDEPCDVDSRRCLRRERLVDEHDAVRCQRGVAEVRIGMR